ncbi:MAG: penicillin-binding transpeptidase domain-containing protein [Lachnospiraceae bacterium]|nr:penicillin-binding transpeptidase domain-containing protein [Lachnospiraceae bacterium]
MDKRLRKKNKRRLKISRIAILAILFTVLSILLIRRLYVLQIMNGDDYAGNFDVMTTKTRTIKSTRGNIYDRNGNVLAYNRLSYSLTLEDSGDYETKRQRSLALNGEAYQIARILESTGDSLSNDFHVVLDANGNYAYDVSGSTLQRFKADVYGCALTTDMTNEQSSSSADDMIRYLVSTSGYSIENADKPYTSEELAEAGLPETLTKQEILDIVFVRYQLFTTSYRKYVPVTIATDISDNAVAILSEQKANLTGIDIQEDSVRVYDSPEAFASIIGYTGKISSEELAELSEENSNYSTTSIVGKSGVEQIMETYLQGSDGVENVYVNNVGRVLKIDSDSTVEPVAGNDVYLTIDKDLTIAAYQILEQRIAGVLESVIINADSFDVTAVEDTLDIRIPITDVYRNIFTNNVLDADHFFADDASTAEQEIAALFTAKQSSVFAEVQAELTASDPTPYNELSAEMQEYETYIVDTFLSSTTGILDTSLIDKTDATYLAWTRDENISLREYLTYAISRNWVDIGRFSSDESYLDSEEVYTQLSSYIQDSLSTESGFSSILYKYLVKSGTITGTMVIQSLYDQGILQKDDGTYDRFLAGTITNYDLIISKIDSLELTPAMLALDPCSGSIVVTDVNTGEVLACVSYPGYDNNRLANTMDVAYYNKLAADQSGPFFNKATQQKTAPGSTFKLITATAGLNEGAITADTSYYCSGVFERTETPLRCWLANGHGDLDLVGGIMNSCNIYFCNVGYELGVDDNGDYSDSIAIDKLTTYAKMYNMDKNSGIEVPEATPQVSDSYGIASSIGQGTNSYTLTQMSRYVTSIANSGTSYNLSILDRVTDTNGSVIVDFTPSVESTISIDTGIWNKLHEGMRAVITDRDTWNDMAIEIAGKTGTAEQSTTRPSHALFISYGPYENPEISVVARMSNGYSSGNAVLIGKDVYQYYYNMVETAQILTGTAMTESISNERIDG